MDKHLSSVINKVIKHKLTYLVYNQVEHIKYRHYQEDFIKENRLLIRHLNIYKSNTECLGYYPNIKSINHTLVSDLYNNNSNYSKINAELPCSKRLKIVLADYRQSLKEFKDYLKQIEVFEICGISPNTEEITNSVNLNNLKTFKLHSYDDISFKALDTIKTKFNKLEILEIKSSNYIKDYCKANPSISFNSSLELRIQENFNIGFYMQDFGDVKQF